MRLTVRMPSELAEFLSMFAQKKGLSKNALMLMILTDFTLASADNKVL